MTFIELAKAAWPGATDEEASFALWERTPFPFDANPRLLFKRISGYRRACANGILLCTFCHRPAVKDEWDCEKCAAALKSNA